MNPVSIHIWNIVVRVLRFCLRCSWNFKSSRMRCWATGFVALRSLTMALQYHEPMAQRLLIEDSAFQVHISQGISAGIHILNSEISNSMPYLPLLKFGEKTNKMLYLEHGFVWCWNLDASGSRSEIPGKFCNVVLEKDGEDQLDRSCEKWRNVT